MDRVRGQIALVTGAASGIGKSIALELARRGAIVTGLDRDREKLSPVAEQLGTEAIAADISSREACEKAVASLVAQHGRVDIVVNCAGISLHKSAQAISVEDIERVFAVNFFGAVYLTQAVLPQMLQRRDGSIVNVSSLVATLPNPKESAYAATKAALLMWTHSLSVDLRDTGVYAGALLPGPTATGIWQTLDEPASYKGKLYSPDVAARAAARMIDRRETHVTAPRRYGVLSRMYALFGRPMRWSLGRYDSRG